MMHNLLYSVSLVQHVANGNLTGGSGTGFFYFHEGRVYLVTNRHVIRDPSMSVEPDSLRLHLHRNSDPSQSTDVTVSLLNADGSPTWKQAPGSIDIASVPLDHALLQGFRIATFNRDML